MVFCCSAHSTSPLNALCVRLRGYTGCRILWLADNLGYILLRDFGGAHGHSAPGHSAFGHSAPGHPAPRTLRSQDTQVFRTYSSLDIQLPGHSGLSDIQVFRTYSSLDKQLPGHSGLSDVQVLLSGFWTVFGKFSDFWKIFRFLEDFQIFGRFSDFWKIFGRFSDFWKILRFLEDFQIFGRISGFWTIPGILTFETLFTILTIENLNS